MQGEIPREGADEWAWLRFGQSDVVTVGQAVALIGRSAVRRSLRQQRWRSICRDVVLTHNDRLSRAQQLWVAVLAAGAGARLAGQTAAAEQHVRGLRAEPIEILIPAGRHPTSRLTGLPPDMAPVRVHRTTVLPPDHLQVGSPPRTSIARSVVDAAAWAPSDRAAQAVILSACQQRRVTPDALRKVVGALSRVRRRALIRRTIADAEGGADALSEVDFVTLCRRHGLPEPELQTPRRDAGGRTRYLDAYWPRARLHVEVDGAHHMSVEEWTSDMLRQNTVWLSGDRILRFSAWLVRTQPALVAGQLRAALSPYPT